jgi:hypothetical protein
MLQQIIRLDAYELPRLDYHAGDTLSVTLIWEAVQPLDRGYTAFVHLTRPDGSVISQHDGLPANGTRPTDTWAPGDQISDNHQFLIPPDTPSGEYWLRVGMYDDVGRLPVTDPGLASVADNVILLRSIVVN